MQKNEVAKTIGFVDRAMNYALECHRKVNQTYDGHPYEYHLKMVNDVFHEYKSLIPVKDRDRVEAALWLHDVIEDTGVTYNDVVKATDHFVADIVYALTNNKGKNRKQRANSNYYRGIRVVEYADFAKMCDRLANVRNSYETRSSMLKVYRREHDNFMYQLFNNKYYGLIYDINKYLDDNSYQVYMFSLRYSLNRMLDKPVLYLIEKLSSI
jgi:(p)ppGpp synthase/HD superfamily hydrolase